MPGSHSSPAPEEPGDGDQPGIPGEYEAATPRRPSSTCLVAHRTSILFSLVREDPHPWRFSELENTLRVSPNTLSSRLEELVAAGLLERESHDEIPPRVEYTATQKVRDLEPVFREHRHWAESHGYETGLEGQYQEGRGSDPGS